MHICIVSLCKTDYKTDPKIVNFAFPKDIEFKMKWIAAIHRKNYVPTKHSRV